jgi:chromosome segregation ATPase
MKASEWRERIHGVGKIPDDTIYHPFDDIIADLEAEETTLFNAQQALITEGVARQKAEAEVKRYADAYTQLDEANAEIKAERDGLKADNAVLSHALKDANVHYASAEAENTLLKTAVKMGDEMHLRNIHRLQAELASLTLRLGQMRGPAQEICDATGSDASDGPYTRLRALLSAPPGDLVREVREYMEHKRDCNKAHGFMPDDRCTCGLDALLIKLGGER